jgi:hypothetical protein
LPDQTTPVAKHKTEFKLGEEKNKLGKIEGEDREKH